MPAAAHAVRAGSLAVALAVLGVAGAIGPVTPTSAATRARPYLLGDSVSAWAASTITREARRLRPGPGRGRLPGHGRQLPAARRASAPGERPVDHPGQARAAGTAGGDRARLQRPAGSGCHRPGPAGAAVPRRPPGRLGEPERAPQLVPADQPGAQRGHEALERAAHPRLAGGQRRASGLVRRRRAPDDVGQERLRPLLGPRSRPGERRRPRGDLGHHPPRSSAHHALPALSPERPGPPQRRTRGRRLGATTVRALPCPGCARGEDGRRYSSSWL